MWTGAARRDPLLVAVDLDDADLLDALAEALARHPALALAGPDDAPAVTVVDGAADARATTLALGALPVDAGPDLILAAAHLVAAGFSLNRAAPAPTRAPKLGTRAREVLELMVDGASNKAIARRLGISPHTAKFHVAAVLRELGAHNRAEAVALALREGLVLL